MPLVSFINKLLLLQRMDLLEGSTLFQDRRFEEDPVLKALYVLLMTHEGDEIKPPSREILMPAQATVSIGANYELSGLMPGEMEIFLK